MGIPRLLYGVLYKRQLDSVDRGLEFFYILADLSFQFCQILLHIFCRPVG